MTRAATQEQRFDHQHDLRKNGDLNDFPDRMNQPLSTALDIVLLVRGMSNLQAAASLVESYADLKAAGARIDQHRETTDLMLAQFEVPNV